MPKINVIVPTYNNAKYLREAIDSILNQSAAHYDILVVDDGSTDETRDIVSSYGNQVRYLYQENQGLAVARNTGIANTKGKYFTFLDGDDLWEPDNLEIKLDIMEQDDSIGAAFSDFTLFNDTVIIAESGIQVQYPIFFRRGHSLESIFSKQQTFHMKNGNELRLFRGNIFNSLLFGNFINACSILVRRESQEQVGFFRPELRTQQDYEYWLRFSQENDFCFVDRALVHYRRHSTQLTAHKNMARIIGTVIGILTPYYENIATNGNTELKNSFSKRLAASNINLGLAHLGNRENSQARQAFFKALKIAHWDYRLIPYFLFSCLPAIVTKDFYDYLRK